MIIQHLYKEKLNISPWDHPVLLAEKQDNPKQNRAKLTQVMFEDFGVPGMFLCPAPPLALFGVGHITGLVLDCGEEVTHSVPIGLGHTLLNGIGRIEVGGWHVTEHLVKLLTEKGNSFTTAEEREVVVKGIKETCGYIALDPEKEKTKYVTEINHSYKLPDGQIIQIGDERFRAPECLFDPSLLGMQRACPGIHQLIHTSIAKVDIDYQSDLYGNIILAGGSTKFPGMEERVNRELAALLATPPMPALHVTVPTESEAVVWRGGAALSSLSSFRNYVITVEDYNDSGPSIVHRRCYGSLPS